MNGHFHAITEKNNTKANILRTTYKIKAPTKNAQDA